MRYIKLFIAYWISVILLSICPIGMFHSYFWTIEDSRASFYITLSSLFFAAVCFFLSWFYSNLIIRQRVLNKLTSFGIDSANLDCRRISVQGLEKKTGDLIDYLRSYEDYKFELFGFCIPFLSLFCITAGFSLFINPRSIFSHLLSCSLCFLIIKFAGKTITACDIRSFKNYYIPTINNIIRNTKGIQFYNSRDFISNDLLAKSEKVLKNTESDLSRVIWKSLFFTCVIFAFLCLCYIFKLEYFPSELFDISGIETIFYSSVFFYLLHLVSLLRYVKIKQMQEVRLSNYTLLDSQTQTKPIDTNNLFIAFHGVCFRDPTLISSELMFQNLTFSILPGEFVSVASPKNLDASYIFDLILKFHTPQSGKIYIGGAPSENISADQIRSITGVFDETFALIRGSVLDNLKLITQDLAVIEKVAEKVGLFDNLDCQVFDEGENFALPQEDLFRIQIARIIIQKPKVLLIKTPEVFETESSKHLFYDFVSTMPQNKTTIIITNNPKIIVYSDKILFLDSDGFSFGSHADISENRNYQKYMKSLNLN